MTAKPGNRAQGGRGISGTPQPHASLVVMLMAAGLAACASSQFARPEIAVLPATPLKPPRSQTDLSQTLGSIVKAYETPGATAISARATSLNGINPGVVTLGAFARDIEQKGLDQVGPLWTGNPPVKALALGDACALPSEPVESRQGFADAGVANPPEPHFVSTWIPVAINGEVLAGVDVSCPATSNASYVCLFGRLAMQRSSADVVLVVHGLFDSSAQVYVRSTASALFAMGHSVLMLDMRDHGRTLREQPHVPTTLGWFEQADLMNVARALRGTEPCSERTKRIGVLGFSAGGMMAIRAFVKDRQESEPPLFDAGVVAVSPILDTDWTIANMTLSQRERHGKSCGILGMVDLFGLGASSCLGRGSIGYVFMELLKLRWNALAASHRSGVDLEMWEPSRAMDPKAYIDRRVRSRYREAYGIELGNRLSVTPKQLAVKLGRIRRFDDVPFLTVLGSLDDPVVGGEGIRGLAREVGQADGRCEPDRPDAPPVCILMPPIGGHMAFDVVSPGAYRAVLATYFGWRQERP